MYKLKYIDKQMYNPPPPPPNASDASDARPLCCMVCSCALCAAVFFLFSNCPPVGAQSGWRSFFSLSSQCDVCEIYVRLEGVNFHGIYCFKVAT